MFPAFFTISAASAAVIGAFVVFLSSAGFVVPVFGSNTVLSLSFTCGKFPFTFDNVVGVVVPSGPFTDVFTSSFGTSAPVPSGFSKNLVVPSFCFIGYTFVPSALVYTTGVTELFVDTWSFTSTVIVLTPLSSVFPLTVAVPFPTNLTSFAFFTCSEYSPVPSVVLSELTTHPIFLKSPTVATLLSGTLSLVKFTNPAAALLSAAFIVSNPLLTFPNVLGSVVAFLSSAAFGFTKLVFILFFVTSVGCAAAVPSAFLNVLVFGSNTFPSKSLSL